MNKDQASLVSETVLKRTDQYILAANSKAAVLLAVNTFLLGSIILKSDVLIGTNTQEIIATVIWVLSVIAMGGCAGSAFMVIWAISPFLESGNKPGTYHSLIFFGSIAQMDQDEYVKQTKVKLADEAAWCDDLLKQCHTLAKGAKKKHDRIKWSAWTLMTAGAIPLVVISILRTIDRLVD